MKQKINYPQLNQFLTLTINEKKPIANTFQTQVLGKKEYLKNYRYSRVIVNDVTYLPKWIINYLLNHEDAVALISNSDMVDTLTVFKSELYDGISEHFYNHIKERIITYNDEEIVVDPDIREAIIYSNNTLEFKYDPLEFLINKFPDINFIFGIN